jgi:hypothetical protein
VRISKTKIKRIIAEETARVVHENQQVEKIAADAKKIPEEWLAALKQDPTVTAVLDKLADEFAASTMNEEKEKLGLRRVRQIAHAGDRPDLGSHETYDITGLPDETGPGMMASLTGAPIWWMMGLPGWGLLPDAIKGSLGGEVAAFTVGSLAASAGVALLINHLVDKFGSQKVKDALRFPEDQSDEGRGITASRPSSVGEFAKDITGWKRPPRIPKPGERS